MEKKKQGEFYSVIDVLDKESITEISKTLLERFEEEIDWLIDSEYATLGREKQYLAAIANQDYIKASEYQHQVMILQYHRAFVPRIKAAIADESMGETLDELIQSLLGFILSPSFVGDRPRAYELAKLDAYREEWKLANRILKARDK
jgi:hypothetical protein